MTNRESSMAHKLLMLGYSAERSGAESLADAVQLIEKAVCDVLRRTPSD
jgi:hypothetical protein